MTFSEDSCSEDRNYSAKRVRRYSERSSSLAPIPEEGQSSVSVSSEVIANYDVPNSLNLTGPINAVDERERSSSQHSFQHASNQTDEMQIHEGDVTRPTLLDGLKLISLDGSALKQLEEQVRIARRSMTLGQRPRAQKEYLDAIQKYVEDGGEQCNPLVSTVVAELAQSFDSCTKDETPAAVCFCLDLLKSLMSAVLPDPKIYTSVLSTLDRLFGAHGGTRHHQFLVSDYKPVLVFQQSIVQSPIFVGFSLLTEFLK